MVRKRTKSVQAWAVIGPKQNIIPGLIAWSRKGCIEEFNKTAGPAKYKWRAHWRRKRGYRIARVTISESAIPKHKEGA